jgi:protein O-GlcNAc transferase
MQDRCEALAGAVRHQQAGRFRQAEAIYRRILAEDPGDPDALHLLGFLAHQLGRHEAAVDYIARAIARNPSAACYHVNLGNALQALARFEEAAACYREALRRQPDSAEPANNLGNALAGLGRFEEAMASFLEAIRLRPDWSLAYSNLGNVLKAQGRLEEAQACYQEALRLEPASAEAHNNLGVTLQQLGRLEEALACYREALRLKPDYADAHYNLGNGFKDQGQLEEAAASYQRAIAIRRDYAEAHNNLGFVLKEQGRLEESIASYRQALRFRPRYAEAFNNLGNALYEQGQLEEAVRCYREALALKPDFAMAHSNLLFVLHYELSGGPGPLFAEHLRWAAQQAPATTVMLPHPGERAPERRLRIGYASPDFRAHSVAYFIEPILEAHDRLGFEVFCYSDVSRPDAVTARLQSLADGWRSTFGMSEAQVENQVRQDRIDILVDLAGHTGGNRLLVFARKPAPVQVTYLGYPDTTGLRAIDYRITDEWADPPGQTEHLHTEELVRLPRGFLCYRPPRDAPEIAPLPALGTGAVTFGSFNNLAKMTPEVIALWSALLREVPGARLILKSKALGDAGAQERIRETFRQNGVAAQRIVLWGVIPGHRGHLEAYQQIDIALDSYPYHGTTTTCEALWMGVPVIVLAGGAHVSRVGVSLLSAVGLAEFIADSPERYLELAAGAARDLSRLERLRAQLRDRMTGSPLTAVTGFTRTLEDAYRRMWRRWCGPVNTLGGTVHAATPSS